MSLPEALGSGDPDEGEAQVDEEIIRGALNEKAVTEVMDAVKWQVDHNLGFVRSFISSARFGPTSGQHESWREIGMRLDEQRERPDDGEAQRNGFKGGKVLVLMGNKDAIILRNEVEPDIKRALGRQNVKMTIFEAGHDLPVHMSGKVTEAIWDTWKEVGIVP